MNKAFESLLDGNKDKANSGLHLSQGCADAYTLLYTVSENTGALYTRYVQAEAQVATEGAQIAAKCGEILKQKGVVPKY